MGRFTKQNADAQKVWKEANLVVLTEEQLKKMDARIQEKFNGFKTKKDLYAYIVNVKAASWIQHGEIAVRLPAYEIVMDRIEQWRRWRERKFPFDQRVAYEKLAEQRGYVAKDHTVQA